MKNILLSLITAFTLSACNSDDKRSEIDKLPQATQIGANTIGCLVNGMAFTPKGYMFTKNCFYNDGLNFGLSVSMDTNNGIKLVNIGCLNTHFEEGQTYPLKEKGPDLQYGEYSIDAVPPPDPNYYSTTASVNGELKITHFDYDHAILSGTFWFDVVNSKGEKVQIREGRFDMHY